MSSLPCNDDTPYFSLYFQSAKIKKNGEKLSKKQKKGRASSLRAYNDVICISLKTIYLQEMSL